jgi:hypothetical protein
MRLCSLSFAYAVSINRCLKLFSIAISRKGPNIFLAFAIVAFPRMEYVLVRSWSNIR